MLNASLKMLPAAFVILVLVAFLDLIWSVNTTSVLEMMKAASLAQQNS